MITARIQRRGATLLCAGALLAAAMPAGAQLPEKLVLDGNIFWDNDAGSYSATSGGLTCPGGAYTVTDLATVKFTRNRDIDPKLNAAVYDFSNPRWDPQAGSPALGLWGALLVRPSSFDAWFEDVCYAGAVNYTGGDDSKDWTRDWTYYNTAGGLGRTDINLAKPLVTVTTDVAANTVWSNANNYALVGRIAVLGGVTLEIQPGTVVLGSGVGSFLVIERGGRLQAEGTRAEPIIFTSDADFTQGFQAPGDWGGVVLNGRAVANCSGTISPKCGLTDDTHPCQSEGDVLSFFGGADDDDNSGSLKYCRVEYAGFELSPNNELNAWTFNAVGRGTTVDYIQGHAGSDDNLEWFGGAVRCKHLVSTAGQDDNIDWQMGFRGFIQFAVCQLSALSDRGIEADNNEFGFNCAGRSNPVLANLTLIGRGPQAGGAQGITLRRGTAAVIVNSIVQGFSSNGLQIQNEETFANCAGATPPLHSCNNATDTQAGGGREGFTASIGRNPTFGPTTLSFRLPEPRHVTVRVFDVTGRLVGTLADGRFAAGPHTLDWDPSPQVPAGAYFYQVAAGPENATGRILVLK
jgi:hypothetical protein